MKASRAVFALAAAGMLASACTVGPNYVKPDLPAPQAFSEAASTPRTAVTAQDADLSAWWTQFGDPILNNLIKRALADNPDLKAAASRVREARAQTRIAAALALPTLSASGNALTYNSDRKSTSASGSSASGLAGLPIPSHASLYSAGFDASWEVDLFGGARRAVEAAKDNAEGAEWSRRDGQVTLLAEVANAYLTLRALQARIAIGQEALQRQKDQFQLIQARRRTGFVTDLDVNQQSVQVATSAAEIPQLQAMASAEIHALGVLLGQPPETLAPCLAASAPTLPPPPPTLPTGLPSELLLRRPDLREAERRLATANAQIGVQTADLYPKLNLIGLGSFAAPKIENLFETQNVSTLGVGMLTAPIFDGGRARAGAAAQNTLKIAQDQYRSGLVTFINVLQAQNALLNSRDQLTQSDAQTLSDIVAVYKALGGGWTTAS